jgi:GR25 family glycosyltransferase involved in LPS biosynthesis
VKALSESAMKIYLINLDRHPERLAHMRKQLDGVAFERVSAVDGARRPPTTEGLTRFELACLDSHRTAWRKFLASADSLACFLEDDVHVQPGFAALLSEAKWPPKDAHAVKLDTYFQKVRLGERRSASGGREIARLYSRHESAAAYILSRDGATRYLELTESASQPADYAVFPNSPRRLGLSIYQLVPAIAIQDHLLKDGKHFATAMNKTDARAAAGRSSVVGKLGRESARLAGQVSNLGERAYQRAFLRVETTTVGLE